MLMYYVYRSWSFYSTLRTSRALGPVATQAATVWLDLVGTVVVISVGQSKGALLAIAKCCLSLEK